jgi:hypothetical protein
MMKSTRAVASLLTLGALAVGLLASKPAAAGSVRCMVKVPQTTSTTDAQNVRKITYCGISGEYAFGQVTKTGANTYTLAVTKASAGAGNATVILVDALFGNQSGNCTLADGPGGGGATPISCTAIDAATSLWMYLVVN